MWYMGFWYSQTTLGQNGMSSQRILFILILYHVNVLLSIEKNLKQISPDALMCLIFSFAQFNYLISLSIISFIIHIDSYTSIFLYLHNFRKYYISLQPHSMGTVLLTGHCVLTHHWKRKIKHTFNNTVLKPNKDPVHRPPYMLFAAAQDGVFIPERLQCCFIFSCQWIFSFLIPILLFFCKACFPCPAFIPNKVLKSLFLSLTNSSLHNENSEDIVSFS